MILYPPGQFGLDAAYWSQDLKVRLCFTIRGDGRELTICYSARELRFLGGPLLPAGERFVIALGVFNNFTVAEGQKTDAWVSRARIEVLDAAKALLESIAKAQALLEYDYQYGLSSEGSAKHTGGRTVTIEGKRGIIDARRPGQIYLLMDEGVVYDLRLGQTPVTDQGVVKVYRRKNKIGWHPKLMALIEYLQSLKSDTVQIRHHAMESAAE